jgi:hypothetical protein
LKYILIKLIFFILNNIKVICFFKMGIGDWGLGIGDWGLGPIPKTQYPKPKTQK